MRRVLKWTVPVDDRDHPIGGGRVVLVDTKGNFGVVLVWTEETQPTPQVRRARVYGTGQPVPDHDDEWIGSTVAGPLVWHVYAGASS